MLVSVSVKEIIFLGSSYSLARVYIPLYWIGCLPRKDSRETRSFRSGRSKVCLLEFRWVFLVVPVGTLSPLSVVGSSSGTQLLDLLFSVDFSGAARYSLVSFLGHVL